MLHEKQVKSVLNKHKKRESWFLDDYSVNPYEGCSCNCLYCYGENMEQGLTVKSNALEYSNNYVKAFKRNPTDT